MAVKPRVEAALAELRAAVPSSDVTWTADADGGAIVTMETVPLNADVFAQSHTWMGFHITFQYPRADVYPHHVRPDLTRRRDGEALVGDGLHPNRDFHGRKSLMLSRRTKRPGPRDDTAARKLMRVLAWLEQCARKTST